MDVNQEQQPVVFEEPPRESREPFWNYMDLLLIAGLSFAALVVLFLGLGLVRAISPAVGRDPALLVVPAQFVLYVLVYLAFRITFLFRYNAPVFKSLGWREVPFHPLGIVLGGVGLAILVSLLAAALKTPTDVSPFENLVNSRWMLAFLVLLAVVFGPVSEELVFRGFLQPLLSRSFGVASGIGLTALIFGLLHGPEYKWAWQYVLAVSFAGVVFGIVRARTNSFIPSTLMHACYNAVFVGALIAAKFAKLK
jgi:membrane protease YdiL (CAAX protease family)